MLSGSCASWFPGHLSITLRQFLQMYIFLQTQDSVVIVPDLECLVSDHLQYRAFKSQFNCVFLGNVLLFYSRRQAHYSPLGRIAF